MEVNFRPDSGMVTHLGIRTNAGSSANEFIRKLCEIFEASLLDIQTMEIIDVAKTDVDSFASYRTWSSNALGHDK
jgi:hypothetical protein